MTSLWFVYGGALSRLRRNVPPLSPIFGWMVGLCFFILLPLTFLVVNGGYRIPAIYRVNDSYASVDLTTARYLIPMCVIWLALMLSFQAVLVLAGRRMTAIDSDQEDG